MTRRRIIFKNREGYYISQEFNGDYNESQRFNLSLPKTANWKEVINLFDKVENLNDFRLKVIEAESFYGYPNVPLKKEDKIPYSLDGYIIVHAMDLPNELLNNLKKEEFSICTSALSYVIYRNTSEYLFSISIEADNYENFKENFYRAEMSMLNDLSSDCTDAQASYIEQSLKSLENIIF